MIKILSKQGFELDKVEYDGSAHYDWSPLRAAYGIEVNLLTSMPSSCSIGENSVIGDFAKIKEGATIGANCYVGENCIIEKNAIVGNFSQLYESVTVSEGAVIGERCSIHRGAKISPSILVPSGITIGEFAKVTERVHRSIVYNFNEIPLIYHGQPRLVINGCGDSIEGWLARVKANTSDFAKFGKNAKFRSAVQDIGQLHGCEAKPKTEVSTTVFVRSTIHTPNAILTKSGVELFSAINEALNTTEGVVGVSFIGIREMTRSFVYSSISSLYSEYGNELDERIKALDLTENRWDDYLLCAREDGIDLFEEKEKT